MTVQKNLKLEIKLLNIPSNSSISRVKALKKILGLKKIKTKKNEDIKFYHD